MTPTSLTAQALRQAGGSAFCRAFDHAVDWERVRARTRVELRTYSTGELREFGIDQAEVDGLAMTQADVTAGPRPSRGLRALARLAGS
ncbi:MAG: hypothetical protein AAFX81_17445 [Pseudomonadota bacterium]